MDSTWLVRIITKSGWCNDALKSCKNKESSSHKDEISQRHRHLGDYKDLPLAGWTIDKYFGYITDYMRILVYLL